MEEADLLNRFQFTRILSQDSRAKCVYLLGRIPSQDHPEMADAILYFEKHHFYDSELPILASNRITELVDTERNDIYHWAKTNLVKDLTRPDVNIRIIYPATKAHIDKYSSRPLINIRETSQDYIHLTKPFIEEQPLKRVQWVYNILEGKAEAERVLLRDDKDPDNGFLLLPDMKWDLRTMDALYLVVLVLRRDLRSIRDLDSSHLPLLRNIRETVEQFVEKTYGVKSTNLRMFFHYQPSYYHLHIHVVHTAYTSAPGIIAGQAHLLDQVIDNIDVIDNNYYQRATLPFVLADNHELCKRYIEVSRN
ncbi:HIT-like domain-containing protein [Umbelopsis sp. PMI_123]|nr:HIT-like domain-containing protein [Umbelopsis sp. PMI_123]